MDFETYINEKWTETASKISLEMSESLRTSEESVEPAPAETIFKRVIIYNTESWSDSASQIIESSEISLEMESDPVVDSTASLVAPVEICEEVISRPCLELVEGSEPRVEERWSDASSSLLEESFLTASETSLEEGLRRPLAGHVAAMREKFESLTRSASPSDRISPTPPPLN